MELKDDILKSCKSQLDIHIDKLKQQGMSETEIEIELVWYIKYKLRGEKH